jgi:hypothetical protein
MKFSIALMKSLTGVKLPRRMAWRVMIKKKIILRLAVCGRANPSGRVGDGDLDASAASGKVSGPSMYRHRNPAPQMEGPRRKLSPHPAELCAPVATASSGR